MTYKSKEKSFFENAVKDTKEGIDKIEEKGTKKVLKWYDFGASSLRAEIKRRPAQYFFLFVSTFLGSVITSSIALLGFSGNLLTTISLPHSVPKTNSYVAGTAVKTPTEKFDPLLLASKLRKNDKDFDLVDIRSATDFRSGHIITAVNLPVYNTLMVTPNGDLNEDAIKVAFKTYTANNRLLILYGQNAYATVAESVASILNSDKKAVKALAVGWDEWLHLNSK